MGKALKRWWPLFMLPTCLAFMIGFVIPFYPGLLSLVLPVYYH